MCILLTVCEASEHLSLHLPGLGWSLRQFSVGEAAESQCVSLRGCSCIFFCALVQWWDLLTWYILQMEKLNTYSKKVFALLPRHCSAVRGCIFAGTSLVLGRFSSIPGVSLNPGLLKGISPYSSVFRQVSDTQIQGRTKDAFKVSESLLGRVIPGLKYRPWKLWSGVCCA